VCLEKKVAIKFYNSKLNTLKNDKDIDTFITAFPEHHKILIVSEISSKTEKQIMESKNFEVYRMLDIVRDISKHHLVPMDKKLAPYELTLKTMGKDEKDKWGEIVIQQMEKSGINIQKDKFIFLKHILE
jgi:hypothetical protein